MSEAEDKHAAASQQLTALTSSLPQGGQPDTSGKESEQATANQSTTRLTTPLSPRGQRDTSIVPRDEDHRDIIDRPLPALTYSPLPHGGQPSADKMASGKKGEQVTAKQTATALAAPFSPREARRESSTSMVPIEEDGRAMVEQGLPALTFLPLQYGGQPEATNMASCKKSEQSIAKQPMPAMTKPLSTCEGERESSTILGDKDQRAIVDHSLSALKFLRSPHDDQPDAIKMVSSGESEQTTTNQPVTTMTTPLPPRERQRESSATPIHEYQPTIVDHQLPTVTFSMCPPQDGQPRTSEMANAKESEQVTANQPITALGASLPPCEGQQMSVLISSAEDQPANLHQPSPALTSSLSAHDGRRDTIKVVSSKERELSTTSQSATAPSLCLGPKESSMIPSDQKAIVKASLPALAALLSREGQQQEAVKMAATNGCKDQRTAIHIAPIIKQASDATSPLSPLESRHEAAQTTTVAAATTAATATTGAPTSPLDHVLICGHGRFQKITLACTTLAFFTTIVHALASANLASPVDHWCKPTAKYSYMDPEAWRNISIPVVRDEDGVERRSQCQRFEPPLPYAGSSAEYPDNRTLVSCDAGWEYKSGASSGNPHCSVAFGFPYSHSIVDEWDLVCGRSWMVSALAAAYMAGGVLGAPLAGIACDRIGRRPVLGNWLLLLVCAGIPLVFANNVPLFATLRFLLSAGAAGVLVAAHVMLFEVTDSRHRVTYCAIAVAGATFLAAVYTELVSTFLRNWHVAQVAYMVPTLGLIIAAYLVEESPCWLLAVSELRYAESVLSRAAGVNRVEQQVFRRRLSVLRVEMNKQHEQPGTLQEQEGANAIVSDHEVRISDLVSNHSLRQKSAVIFSCWFLAFGTFSHLSTGHVMRANEGARATLVFMRLPCVVADVYAITRVGRRLSLAASMLALSVLIGAMSFVNAFGYTDQLTAVLVITALLVFDVFAIAAFPYSAELYPTVLRGAALGFCYMSGYMGAFVASFINEIRSPPLRGAAYAISAAMLLLSGIMALALPETRQLPPSNTVHGMMVVEDKWQLYSPLRVARGGGKRRRSKTALPESHQMRRRSSLLRQQAVLRHNQAAP